MADDADVIVVGGGLAGLVAATEIADAGKHVIVVDQEGEQSLGGQAFWSFGGLFLVDSPEQRRMGIRDSHDLAMQDWLGSAGFDRGLDDPTGEDYWARQWATAYLDFANGEKRSWLHAMGVRWFAVVEPSLAVRGTASSRTEVGGFELHAPAVIVTSGGIGANHDLVRELWPERLGPAPAHLLSGVPEHVDGRMLGITEAAGGRVVN